MFSSKFSFRQPNKSPEPSKEITLTGIHTPPEGIKQLASNPNGNILALREFVSQNGTQREVWAYNYMKGWHKPALQGGQITPLNGVAYGKNRLFAYANTQKCGIGWGLCDFYYDGVRTYEPPTYNYPEGRLFDEGSMAPSATIVSNLKTTSGYGFSNADTTNGVMFYNSSTGEAVMGGGTILDASANANSDSLVQTNGILAQPGSGLVWLGWNGAVYKYVQQPGCTGTGCISYNQIGTIPSSLSATQLRQMNNNTLVATGIRTSSFGSYWAASYDLGVTWTALPPLPLDSSSWSQASLKAHRVGDMLFLSLVAFNQTETHLYSIRALYSNDSGQLRYYGRHAGNLEDAAVTTIVTLPSGNISSAILTIANPNPPGSTSLPTQVKCWSIY